ncbi:phospholipase D A isoform X2 [Folsomia candida]|uniref:Uncharacterized protein n=1 Tax=Folsomia candida TaxID=158441 RepID=A0A226E172_FOLCA|nr:phospholipase D A isoform X2 [Folsomia candida]OXA50216.1 hypothetical protein Fcan01_15005 [Folsomia candida]
MRRGGGYTNQSSVLHNGPQQHGPHHQNQQQNRMGPNRMYHQQQQPHHHAAQQQHQHHQTLQTLQTLQNLQNLQNQQMVPYGQHVNNARPLSFPSPPLQQTNNLTSSSSSNSNQQHYAAGGGGGGGGGIGPTNNLVSLSNSNNSGGGISSSANYSNPSTSSLSGSIASSAVLGGDMPPVETVVARLETACRLLHGIGGNHTRVNEIGVEILILSEDLRRVGPLLETAYPDVLDRVMSSMRDASAQPSLPPSLRLAIFELVELRASKWMLPSDSSNYYRQRRNINESVDLTPEVSNHHYNSSSSSTSGAGNASSASQRVVSSSIPKPEVIFPSDRSPSLGSSPIPSNSTTSETSNNAKTYREEVLIKNSDSGKVAPAAKERVLSINGYSQQSINMAKQLIQETIQRNSSPVFDGLVSTGSEYSGDGDDLDSGMVGALKKMSTSGALQKFCYSVNLGEDVLRITGSNLQFVQEAKFALDDYFSQKYPELFYASNDVEDEEEISEDVQLVPKYDRTTLLSLSLVKTPMPNFTHLDPEVQNCIVLTTPRKFDPDKFCREMSTGDWVTRRDGI